MVEECINCCDEIEDGKEIWDDEGQCFCSEDHKERYHEDDK